MRNRAPSPVGDPTVVVPPLVGLSAVAAHDVALDAQVLAVDQDPRHRAAVRGMVTAQDPAAGSRIHSGGIVRIWVDTRPGEPGPDGDGGGGSTLPQGPTTLISTGTK